MFIWRGFGLAVVGLTLVVLILTELGVERVLSDEHYYQAHGWPKLLGLLLSAALVRLLSNRLDERPARIVIDKATGQELTLRARHDLFFVPLRYWPVILAVAGVGFMIFG